MGMEQLSQQIDAYVSWKRDLVREISRYRDWLERCRLNTPNIDSRLERSLRLLRLDHITLAFVGEYSRGKSELINSLFFSAYGQRMLPSQAGRTTMCPTELFYDPASGHPYIRLLPIETRMSDASIAQFKRSPGHWVNIPLDASDPANMALAFSQVAATKVLPVEQAIQLGFLPDQLESAGKPDMVQVPAWRHALVNFDHPLLRQGLRILDTPGLNALGSEPELTLSMLPNAQSILFLLSADTGVTASDMAMWQNHVRRLGDDGQASLYAVLNKIDVLWDDLAGDYFVQLEIERVQDTVARQLGLSNDEVLPLSAKQALLAKIRGDRELLERSQLGRLEDLLCERIVAQKEKLLQDAVLDHLLSLVSNSHNSLRVRLEKVREQQAQLESQQQDNGQTLFDLTSKTRDDHGTHHKRLLGLKTNQKLLRHQGELLREAVKPERLELHLSQVREKLSGSWTTVGMSQAISHFFRTVESDLTNLRHEADLANRMVEAIYARHNQENPLNTLNAPRFKVEPYLRELASLKEKADIFRMELKTLLTEQRLLTRRFISTLAQEVVGLYQNLRNDIDHWSADALIPLMQYSLEHKQMLETHMLRLKSLAQETQQARQRSLQLDRYRDELEKQLEEAADILRQLRRPPPLKRQAKVVALHGSQRA
ncbi:dynamin-like GTPase family protein [Pseudomonas schmalbachii]|uniref:Dynamin-like GTPase family protein n=1 Tax=Pseudomonas schmalbachii TaxID=2816993 RepID=A0ABS3TXA1_9PSED|nr:dynamin-like GTPase family protein [Pseudomonas schmalbachii]MBO3278292.1 dynamin-like GTPase family protein [Pseudomonas schmalbachii]